MWWSSNNPVFKTRLRVRRRRNKYLTLLKALLSVLSFCYFRRSLKMELASLNQLTVGEVEDKISVEKSALARTQKKKLDFFIPPRGKSTDHFFSLCPDHTSGDSCPLIRSLCLLDAQWTKANVSEGWCVSVDLLHLSNKRSLSSKVSKDKTFCKCFFFFPNVMKRNIRFVVF